MSFAYGFRLEGIGGAAVANQSRWEAPVLRLQRRISTHPPTSSSIADDCATLVTVWGGLSLDRVGATVVCESAAPLSDEDLAHPCLWPAAAVFARWRGWETFHAGAFLSATGEAWGVLGDRGAGKSTLLAELALNGRDVLVDDLLVVDGRDAFAGPRCVDLRPESVPGLGIAPQRLSPVRSTSRLRLALPACAPRVPLAGWVQLAWGDQVQVRSVAPEDRIGLLASHRRVHAVQADLVALLELAAMPALRLTRPRDFAAAPAAREALVAALASIDKPAEGHHRPRPKLLDG